MKQAVIAGEARDPREAGFVPDIYIAMGQMAENVATMTGIGRPSRPRSWARVRSPLAGRPCPAPG